MTGPAGPRPGFDPDELRGGDDPQVSDAEVGHAWAMARELGSAVARDGGLPPSGAAGAGSTEPAFVDAVMAAIAREPAPRPVAAGAIAARQGRVAGVLASVRDAWRVALGAGSRSLVARVGALAYVLVAFVVIGSAGTIAVVGTASLLAPDGTVSPTPMASQPATGPGPSGTPGPTQQPTVASPAPSGGLDGSGQPSPSASSSDPAGSPAPSAEASDDHGDDGSDDHTSAPAVPGSSPSDDHSPDPTRTPRPSDTPKPTKTPGSGGGPTPSP